MRVPRPSPPSELRQLREQEEREAFQNYTAALRNWERARDRADDAAWELQLASAELQQRTLAGCSDAGAAALRQACRSLEEQQRRLQNEARKAKEEASAKFLMLVAARNARAELERALESAPQAKFSSNIVSIAHGALLDCPNAHWN